MRNQKNIYNELRFINKFFILRNNVSTPRKKWTFILEALCEIEKSMCMLAMRPEKNESKKW